jgi:hypothetical protein
VLLLLIYLQRRDLEREVAVACPLIDVSSESYIVPSSVKEVLAILGIPAINRNCAKSLSLIRINQRFLLPPFEAELKPDPQSRVYNQLVHTISPHKRERWPLHTHPNEGHYQQTCVAV